MPSAKKSYTLEYKLKILAEARETSVNGAARANGLSERLVRSWKAAFGEREDIVGSIAKRRRVQGAGRKPILGDLEKEIFDWIIEKRLQSLVVRRKDIQEKAKELSLELQLNDSFKASDHWLCNFMERNNLSLRRSTTLFKMPDNLIIERYMDKINWHLYDDSNVIAMDETAVYFGEASQTTIDIKGSSSIYVPATGYESHRVTCVLGIKRNGTKLPPLIILKSK